ncbi:MAG TPA: tyrosine-type recombinase/integrase [Pseudonocardiaceae bacterium]
MDLTRRQLQVGQVAIETAKEVTVRPYPKSRAGVRTIPIPDFLVQELERHRELTVGDATPVPGSLVFPTRNGTPLRRSNFRRQVWRPALVRAGLLGEVAAVGDAWRASWVGQSGARQHRTFATEREAIEYIAKHAEGGLRYHDLRHSYATWLVSDGVPVNVVQRVMGHEQASTTLNRYTYTPDDYGQRVREAFDDPAPFSLPQSSQPSGTEETKRS